jgi:hypothetical protein
MGGTFMQLLRVRSKREAFERAHRHHPARGRRRNAESRPQAFFGAAIERQLAKLETSPTAGTAAQRR